MGSQVRQNERYQPEITVVTSVFNGSQYLEKAIESVLLQSYPKISYIIVDGGSTDGTVQILERYSNQLVGWISETDRGVYDAWNKALRMTNGEWICFLGADDFFLDRDSVARMIPHLNKAQKENKSFVYGKVVQLTHDLEPIETLGKEWELCKKRFRDEMTLAHCGAFHHQSLFMRNGNFDADFRIVGDYEFLLREYLKNNDFAFFCNEPLVAMRTGGLSGTLGNRLRMANETILARKKNGLSDLSIPVLLWKFRIRFFLITETLFGKAVSNLLADVYRNARGKKGRWRLKRKNA